MYLIRWMGDPFVDYMYIHSFNGNSLKLIPSYLSIYHINPALTLALRQHHQQQYKIRHGRAQQIDWPGMREGRCFCFYGWRICESNLF